jgi:hypothetical protein
MSIYVGWGIAMRFELDASSSTVSNQQIDRVSVVPNSEQVSGVVVVATIFAPSTLFSC